MLLSNRLWFDTVIMTLHYCVLRLGLNRSNTGWGNSVFSHEVSDPSYNVIDLKKHLIGKYLLLISPQNRIII